MVIYSNHRFQCFEQCLLKYKFSYIDNVEITRENVESFLGSRVHEVLEKVYRDIKKGKENSLEHLLDFLNNEWEKKWHDSVIIVKKDITILEYLEKAKQYVTNYYQRYHPFDQGQTLAVEKRILITLDDSKRYKMQGFIDRLVETKKDSYEIHDYKTTLKLPSLKQLNEDRQLIIYTLGVMKKYPQAKNIDRVWHFLAFDQEIRIKKNEDILTKKKKEMIKLIDQIETTQDFEPSPSILCRWCQYQQLCKDQQKKKNKQIKLPIS